MARQLTKQGALHRSPKTTVGAIVTGFAVLLLVGNLDAFARPGSWPLGATANETVEAVLLSQAAQALASSVLDSTGLMRSFAHALLSLSSLLVIIGAGVLLRAALSGKVRARPASRGFFRNKVV
jgi:hypothetical protein